MRTIILLLFFLPFLALASPYYSEYIENQSDKQFLVIFHGENVSPENEPKIKILERKYLEYEDGDYLEYKHLRTRIERELNNLGVSVEVIENPDWKLSAKTSSSLSLSKPRREVRCVRRDQDGNILAIGGDWGVISREEAIQQIKSGAYDYFVKNGANEVLIYVISDRYLRTDSDITPINNLDYLPECY